MPSPKDSFFEELEEEIAFGLSRNEKVSSDKKWPHLQEGLVKSDTNTHKIRHAESPKHHRVEDGRMSKSEHRSEFNKNPVSHPKTSTSDPRKEFLTKAPSRLTLPEWRHVFLPPLRPTSLRIIPISSQKNIDDAMFSFHFENDIVLVNSGIFFAEGRSMFSDIRFLLPLRQKIRGIILSKMPSSLDSFRQTLIHLSRPAVYAPRGVIDALRSNTKPHEGFQFHEIDIRESVSVASFRLQFFDFASSAFVVEAPGIGALIGGGTSELLRDQALRSDVCIMDAASIALLDPKAYVTLGNSQESEGLAAETGSLIDIANDHTVSIHDFRLHLDSFFFDGNGIGNESSHVLKARKQMLTAGVVSIVFIVDRKTRSMLGPIKLETRGLAYLHEAREIHRFIIKVAKASYEQTVTDVPDIEEKDLLKIVKKDLEKALSTHIEREPMIIPIVVEL